MNIRDKVSNEEIVGAERMVSATMVLHGTTNDDAVLAVVRYFWDRLLAPGQVAVDAADLRTLINRTGHDGLSRPEEHDAAMRARAALAATEPAPDSEQGETVEHTDKCCMIGVDPAAGPHPDCPGVAEVQRVASGGGAEADGDEGEDPGSVQGRCPSCGGSSLFLGAGGYVTCSRSDCGEPDAATTLLEHTPAAEPQRVTLPEPTPPIVWTAADDEAWRPERITFNDAEYVRAQPPTPDPAETDALTESERADMDERNKHPLRHDSTCPTCDYPERVTPNGARAIAEQAAKRGRDEALAVVVRALDEAHEERHISDPIGILAADLANKIERLTEAGGDGR